MEWRVKVQRKGDGKRTKSVLDAPKYSKNACPVICGERGPDWRGVVHVARDVGMTSVEVARTSSVGRRRWAIRVAFEVR